MLIASCRASLKQGTNIIKSSTNNGDLVGKEILSTTLLIVTLNDVWAEEKYLWHSAGQIFGARE